MSNKKYIVKKSTGEKLEITPENKDRVKAQYLKNKDAFELVTEPAASGGGEESVGKPLGLEEQAKNLDFISQLESQLKSSLEQRANEASENAKDGVESSDIPGTEIQPTTYSYSIDITEEPKKKPDVLEPEEEEEKPKKKEEVATTLEEMILQEIPEGKPQQFTSEEIEKISIADKGMETPQDEVMNYLRENEIEVPKFSSNRDMAKIYGYALVAKEKKQKEEERKNIIANEISSGIYLDELTKDAQGYIEREEQYKSKGQKLEEKTKEKIKSLLPALSDGRKVVDSVYKTLLQMPSSEREKFLKGGFSDDEKTVLIRSSISEDLIKNTRDLKILSERALKDIDSDGYVSDEVLGEIISKTYKRDKDLQEYSSALISTQDNYNRIIEDQQKLQEEVKRLNESPVEDFSRRVANSINAFVVDGVIKSVPFMAKWFTDVYLSSFGHKPNDTYTFSDSVIEWLDESIKSRPLTTGTRGVFDESGDFDFGGAVLTAADNAGLLLGLIGGSRMVAQNTMNKLAQKGVTNPKSIKSLMETEQLKFMDRAVLLGTYPDNYRAAKESGATDEEAGLLATGQSLMEVITARIMPDYKLVRPKAMKASAKELSESLAFGKDKALSNALGQFIVNVSKEEGEEIIMQGYSDFESTIRALSDPEFREKWEGVNPKDYAATAITTFLLTGTPAGVGASKTYRQYKDLVELKAAEMSDEVIPTLDQMLKMYPEKAESIQQAKRRVAEKSELRAFLPNSGEVDDETMNELIPIAQQIKDKSQQIESKEGAEKKSLKKEIDNLEEIYSQIKQRGVIKKQQDAVIEKATKEEAERLSDIAKERAVMEDAIASQNLLEETKKDLQEKMATLDKERDGIIEEIQNRDAEEVRVEPGESEQSKVRNFAERMAKGEDMTSLEDQQFYDNNKKEVEDALQQIQRETEEGVLRNQRVEETREEEAEAPQEEVTQEQFNAALDIIEPLASQRESEITIEQAEQIFEALGENASDVIDVASLRGKSAVELYNELSDKRDESAAKQVTETTTESTQEGEAVQQEQAVAEQEGRTAEAVDKGDKTVADKVNRVAKTAGVKAKNIRGLYDINRRMFGQNRVKSLASAVVMDRAIGQMAKRAGVPKSEMYSKIKFKKGDESTVKDLSSRGKALFQIVGENANLADNVRTNLQVARDMEADGKDAKTIRIATGWEKGADGKWRYETQDNIPFLKDTARQINQFFSEGLDEGSKTLGQKAEFLLPKELLDLYPQLKDFTIFFDRNMSEDEGEYDSANKKITVGAGVYPKNTVSVLLHEIQHAIQDIEGFAKGGSPTNVSTIIPNVILERKKIGKQLRDLAKSGKYDSNEYKNKKVRYDELLQQEYELVDPNSSMSFEKYKQLAGEVEARNVQARMGMTPEQRRETLLQETEDVAKDEQIVLFQENRNDKGELLAPNGKPSNLSEENWRLVRTPEFKKWFGDWENDPQNASKVVDENGEPMVMYHGSRNIDIQEFGKGKPKRASSGLKEFGTYFTSNKKLAELYSKAPLSEEASQEIKQEIQALFNSMLQTRSNIEYDNIQKRIDELNESLYKGRVYPVFLNLKDVKEFENKKRNGVWETNTSAWNNLEVKSSYKVASNRDAMEFLKEGKFGVEKKEGVIGYNLADGFFQTKEEIDKYLGVVALVFDGVNNAVKLADGENTTFDSSNNILFQSKQGAMSEKDGNYIIYALTDPNVSTPLHEIAHVYEHYLTDAERKAIEEWSGHKSGTVEFSEKFARGFEKYLADGKAPNSKLQKIFDKFKEWLTDIYNGIKGSEIDLELNDEMTKIYDAMLKEPTKQPKSVVSETQGLTPKQQFKQGFEEYTSALKEKEAAKREKASKAAKEKMQKAKARMQEQVDRAKSDKDAKDFTSRIIQSLISTANLGSISRTAVNKLLSKIPKANRKNLRNIIDEAVDVIQNQVERQEASIRRSNRKKAIKKVKDIGVLKELQEPLKSMLSINPDTLPKSARDAYDKVVRDLSMANRKYDRASRDELLKLIQDVNMKYTKDVSRLDAILTRLGDSWNADKTFKENMDAVKDDLNESETEILNRYKSELDVKDSAPEINTEKIKQEFEEAKSEIPQNISGLTKEEREALRKAKNIKTEEFEEMSPQEQRKLVRGMEMLNDGFVGSNLLQGLSRIEAIKRANSIPKNIRQSGLLRKIYPNIRGAVKNFFKQDKESILRETIRSTPLKNLEQIFRTASKEFQKTNLYEALFNPTSVAFARTEDDMKDVNKTLSAAQSLLSINPNERFKQKAKIMMYQLQKEFESNPNNPEVNSAKDWVEATLADPNSIYNDKEKAIIKEMMDGFIKDGEVDSKLIEESFTGKEKRAESLIRRAYDGLTEKAEADAAYRGIPFRTRKNYVHLPKTQRNSDQNIKDLDELREQFLQPSLKSKAAIERTGKTHAIALDPIANANASARKTITSYHMYPAVREAKMTFAYLKKNSEGKENKEIAEVLEEVYGDIVDSQYKASPASKSYTDRMLDKGMREIARLGYSAQLAGVVRAGFEFISNASHAILVNPVEFVSGMEFLSTHFKDGNMSIINEGIKNVGSTQSTRLSGEETLSSKDIETRLLDKKEFFNPERSGSEFRGRAGAVGSILGKFPKGVRAFNDFLMSQPDTSISKAIFIGNFNKTFKEKTGQEANWNKLATDQAYREKYAEAIKEATAVADSAVIDSVASTNPFDGIPKNISDRQAGTIYRAYQMFDRYMTKFRTFEYYSTIKAIDSLMGRGELNRQDAAFLLAGTLLRMSIYKMGIDTTFGILFQALGIDDEDDELNFKDDAMKSTIGAVITLSMGRNLGNVANLGINYGVEQINKELGEGITRDEKEYNRYKDSVVFNKIPMDDEFTETFMLDIITDMSGAYAPLLKTMKRAGIDVARLKKAKKEETKKKYETELYQRIPFEILGNLGLVPAYKDFRKLMIQYNFQKSKEKNISDKDIINVFTKDMSSKEKRMFIEQLKAEEKRRAKEMKKLFKDK